MLAKKLLRAPLIFCQTNLTLNRALYFLRRAIAMNWQHVSEHLCWLVLPSAIPRHVCLHEAFVCVAGQLSFLLMFTRAGRRLLISVFNVFTVPSHLRFIVDVHWKLISAWSHIYESPLSASMIGASIQRFL